MGAVKDHERFSDLQAIADEGRLKSIQDFLTELSDTYRTGHATGHA
jgi:hypothetical protein